jgi:hypothetical protein
VDERDGHIFVNNLLMGDMNFNRPLLFVWQPASLCESVNNSQLKEIDYNMYVSSSDAASNPLIYWSPVMKGNCLAELDSPAGINKLHREFSINSRLFKNYNGPLFKGSELGNYQLLQAFPGSKKSAQLPAEISKILGHSKHFIGAYPPVQ